jgi:hypothetical protein
MTRTPARAECTVCHYRFDKPDMVMKSFREGGGYSGGGQTNSYGKDGTFRGKSVRESNYKLGRKRTAWVCQQCVPEWNKQRRRKFILEYGVGFVCFVAFVVFILSRGN